MKAKVNITNTWCILVSEAVIVPSLRMMTSTVSEEWLARDTQRERNARTHETGWSGWTSVGWGGW